MTALVARDHPAPDRLRARLEAIGRSEVSRALAVSLKPFSGQSVVRIRRLTFDWAGNIDEPDALLSRRLAIATAGAVERAIAAGGDGVVIFPDRAAYLAAFLVAAGKGDAWGRWWFKEFDGLKPLPTSAGLREAMLRDRSVGVAALRRLSPIERIGVLAALTRQDATRILDGLTTTGAEIDQAVSFAAVVTALSRDRMVMSLPSDAHRQLAIGLAAQTGETDAFCRSICEAAATLLALHHALLLATPERARRLVRAALGIRDEELRALVGPDLADRLAPLLSQGRAKCAAAIRPLMPRRAGAHSEWREEPSHYYSPFGGLFLLLPLLHELHLAEKMRDWPEPPEGDAAAIVSLLVLASCSGSKTASRVFADPAWRVLFEIPPRLSWEAAGKWLTSVPTEHWRALAHSDGVMQAEDRAWFTSSPRWIKSRHARANLAAVGNDLKRALAARLPGFADSAASFMWRNVLDVPARIEFAKGAVRAQLARPPLDVLLSMTGLADRSYALPDGRSLLLERSE